MGGRIGMLCTQPEVCMPDCYRFRPQTFEKETYESGATAYAMLRGPADSCR